MGIYDAEVKQRWGSSDAYKEHIEKTANYTKEKWQDVNNGLDAVFQKLAECMNCGYTADSDNAQMLIKSCKTLLPKIIIPARMKFLRGLGRCTLPTSALRLISTNTEMALLNLYHEQ